MEINLTVKTSPKTITRQEAALKTKGGHMTTIDRGLEADEIDYGWDGRNKLVVVNKKWKEFLKRKGNG